MRIGWNLLYLIPGEVGGTETYALETIRALTALPTASRHEFVALVNQNLARRKELLPGSVPIETLSVDATNRTARYWYEQMVLPTVAKRLRVNVLHSMGYVAPARLHPRSVVTIHDLNYMHVPMSSVRRAALRTFVALSARTADTIVTISSFAREEIITHLRVNPGRVCVTPNAAPVDLRSSAHHRVPASTPPSKRPYVLALSSRSPHKNMRRLVRAFSAIADREPSVDLVIAGHLSKDIAIPANLRERMHPVGFVARETLIDLYRGALCFIMPSLYEGFGIPVLEAMALGTPVLCSSRAALPEVAGDAAIYFDPLSEASIGDALYSVCQDAQLRQGLAERGQRQAAKFSWERSATQLLALYEQVGRDARSGGDAF